MTTCTNSASSSDDEATDFSAAVKSDGVWGDDENDDLDRDDDGAKQHVNDAAFNPWCERAQALDDTMLLKWID